jgi:hypothetical protein
MKNWDVSAARASASSSLRPRRKFISLYRSDVAADVSQPGSAGLVPGGDALLAGSSEVFPNDQPLGLPRMFHVPVVHPTVRGL